MANQPNRRRTHHKPAEPKYTFIDFLRDDRFHYAIGIVFCFIGIVTAVCCFAFIYSTKADQSLTLNHTLAEVAAAAAESGEVVENVGGPFGAKLGEWLMVDAFGIGSFVFAIYLFLLGLAILGVRKIAFWTLTFRSLFTMVALSVILGFFSYNRQAYFDLGGNNGRYTNEILLYYSDWLGAFAVSLLLIGLLVTVYYKPIKWFCVTMAHVLKRPHAPVEDAGTAEVAQDGNSEAQAAIEALQQDTEQPAESEAMLNQPEDEAQDEEKETTEDETREEEVSPEEEFEAAKEEIFHPDGGLVIESNNPDAPQLIITNAPGQDGVKEEANEPDAIQDGDHLGLDTVYDPRASHSNYQFPPIELLIDRPKGVIIDEAEQKANTDMIVNSLKNYNVEIQKISATIGPTVTRYEIVPADGTRIAKIKSLEDDIAMSLAALGIRIIAPIPGKGSIGIEVPNRTPRVVSMRTVLESDTFRNNKMRLPMALGATITNDVFMADLTKMPHLLVAGATGQGKSVGLNCIITSLLYSKHPDELKFVLIDPKMVEFSLYQNIAPQYLAKLPDEEKAVITEPQKALETLSSLCVEMEARYQLLSDAQVRVVEAYNEKFIQRRLNPEHGHRYLPYIVMVVDEFADLVATAGKEVYTYIARIVAKARAVGMHMILATQRPSADVIIGMIKANFPARIAFKVTQSVDSKTILDRPGAQRLIGRGDMLTLINGMIERVQCAFVDTEEVEAICAHISSQPDFSEPYELPEAPADGEAASAGTIDSSKINDEFKKCAIFTASQQTISITLLQRQFEIGFGKAARYMDQMQKLGIVGAANGAKPRQVMMTPDEVTRMLSRNNEL